jgi:hypothetical protein
MINFELFIEAKMVLRFFSTKGAQSSAQSEAPGKESWCGDFLSTNGA